MMNVLFVVITSYPVDDDGVCEFCKKEYESENTTEITKLIYRRKLAGFDAPLEHYQDTRTGARYENLLSWNDFRNPSDDGKGDTGDYESDLIELYDALGIFQGNGE